jgi:hypothetical protein
MINISVKVPGLYRRRRSINLLHLVAGLFLIANANKIYNLWGQKGYLPLVPLGVAALISLLYGAFRKKLDPQATFNFSVRLLQAFIFSGYALAFLMSGYGGSSIGLFLWFFIAVLLAFLERVALQEQNVVFTGSGFSFPAGYKQKKVAWLAVADVTLRPDFLTIHYRNNRFLQFELLRPVTNAEIEQLQDFCRRHTGGAAAAGQV